MSNDYSILFEPVQIGPVTTPNRFYQVPHCNGLGYRMPRGHAAMREMKAEGGWGVVCTEETEIHHTSDIMPYVEGRLWSDSDIPALQMMVEKVHKHGALAGIELTHAGLHAINLYSRATSLGPRSMGAIGGIGYIPGQSRRMDKEDIRNLRHWHRQAALRAKRAGFDIIYCYAAHNLSLPMHFMLPRYNNRTDEYGGSLENRVRLFREIIEDTKEAVGGSCAVALRFAVEEFLGKDGLSHQGEGYDIVAMLAELPDLWDVNLSSWENDSVPSRFAKEGFQEKYITFVKSLTSKPVVGVGRYTSPESMVSAITRGIMDLIGAARPSIADPFLPQKIRAGRVEDIRECIGCNVCVIGDLLAVPIRCTQNPTMGEEFRRGWHPEVIAPKKSSAEILIVGGGPAGLECARALGQRGYTVTLTESRNQLGGRVALEAELPGLIEWRRVIDWRLTQINKLPNVKLYPGSHMTAADILEAGIPNVIIATGAHWQRDGMGRTLYHPIPGYELPHVFTPDDVMAGTLPSGNVVIYDDDHYYMGSVLAELLVVHGCQVTLVTPASVVSPFTEYTLEQERIQNRLTKMGVSFRTQHTPLEIYPESVTLQNHVDSKKKEIPCDAVVLVTDRIPNDGIYTELKPALKNGKLACLRVIGDALAPNIIARAVFSGHLVAREFDEMPLEDTPFKMEYIEI